MRWNAPKVSADHLLLLAPKKQGQPQKALSERQWLADFMKIYRNPNGILSLSLNSDSLGINPARLPSDGRVPIFRAGNLIVISNKQVETLGRLFRAGKRCNYHVTIWTEFVFLIMKTKS